MKHSITKLMAMLCAAGFAAALPSAYADSITATSSVGAYTNLSSVPVSVNAFSATPGPQGQPGEIQHIQYSTDGGASWTQWMNNMGVTSYSGSFNWNLGVAIECARSTLQFREKPKYSPRFVLSNVVSTIPDRTAPSVTFGSSTGTPGVWYRNPVTVTFNVNDNCTGFSTIQAATSGEGYALPVFSGAVSDQAGNANPGIRAGSYNVDMTPPGSSINAPATAAVGIPFTISGTASDNLSGIASVAVTVNGVPVTVSGTNSWSAGSHTPSVAGSVIITAAATDAAGNVQTLPAVHYVTVTAAPIVTTPAAPTCSPTAWLGNLNGGHIINNNNGNLNVKFCIANSTASSYQASFSGCYNGSVTVPRDLQGNYQVNVPNSTFSNGTCYVSVSGGAISSTTFTVAK